MTDAPRSEVPQPSREEIGEFYGMARPYAFMDSQVGQQLLSERPRDESVLFDLIYDRIYDDGQGSFTTLTANHNFGRLADYAEATAAEVGTSFELTMPRAFAVHALASLMAVFGRALDEPFPRSDDSATYFLTQFASYLAFQVPDQALAKASDPYDFSQAIAKRVGMIARQNEQSEKWLQQKMFIFADRLLLRQHVSRMISEEQPVEVEDLPEMRRNSNELFQGLRRLGLFSIKAAVHEGANSNWSIHDLFDLRAEVAATVEAAGMRVHPELWPPHMVLWAVEHQHQGLSQPISSLHTDLRPNYDATQRLAFMDDQGELFADIHGAVSLHKLYKQAGKLASYEALRQYLVQEYFDLTMPLSAVARADVGTKAMLGGRNPSEARDRGIVYHDLLLPRIRLIRSMTAEDIEALERTDRAAAAVQSARPSAGTQKKAGDRPGFVRRLPRGHTASDAARELAAEAGEVLGPGETWQSGHERGDPSTGRSGRSRKRRRQKKSPGQPPAEGTATDDAES